VAEMLTIDVGGDGVAVLTLDRAPVNALNAAFLDEIAAAARELADDAGVRAVVVTSAFKTLSAGMDLKEAVRFSVAEQTAMVDGFNETFAVLYGFPKPLVTAAVGDAIAGGLFFVLTADYVVARDGATFGLAEVRVGANFPFGALEIARDALNPAAIRRLMLGGRIFDAAEALRHGFVDAVVPADQVLELALSVARDYAASPPKTYADIKQQIRGPVLDRIQRVIAERSDPVRGGWFTPETQAAMNAMLAKLR